MGIRMKAGNGASRTIARIMPLLACWMLAVATPGALEAIEDVAHVAIDGHTFHDAGHTDPDHCCSGLFHFCSCHAQAPALAPTIALAVARRTPRDLGRVFAEPFQTGPRSGHTSELLRPPTA